MVNKNGTLQKVVVESSENGENRDGVSCVSCEWRQYGDASGFEGVFSQFYKKMENVELAVKQNRKSE